MQKEERTIKKGITKANRACDEAIYSLFQVAYNIGKEVIPLHKFPGLCYLFVKVKTNMMEKNYYDEKNCSEIYFTSHRWLKKY